ncbi:hypothetical protein EZ428_22210 [Pedobacter frigiditerrae]|uniref:Uncharacterized protein n=1 Tax=Pedobacter frigiditerrae TaxID=2530452 RepID=A0A4R0ML64_9SPHI|nr:hypothetical protein [Pedobacter frigiditerrae]TCC86922.1 hypothetical protein EZ428_22210 [Pedobacter frigiditerrae]
MKTSYKILIAFVSIILTSLIVSNISLKAKYKNGDFDILKASTDDIFEMNNLEKVPLKNFKHLVINGSLITKNRREVIFNPNLQINSYGNLPNILGIAANLKSLLKQHVSNDTLYISFEKNNINEKNFRRLNYSIMILQTNNLQSLSTKNLNCYAEISQNSKPFAVIAEKSGITLTNIITDSLTLKVRANSFVNLGSHDIKYKIKSLSYYLAKGSSISVSNKELLGKVNCLNPSKNISENYNLSFSIVSK